MCFCCRGEFYWQRYCFNIWSGLIHQMWFTPYLASRDLFGFVLGSFKISLYFNLFLHSGCHYTLTHFDVSPYFTVVLSQMNCLMTCITCCKIYTELKWVWEILTAQMENEMSRLCAFLRKSALKKKKNKNKKASTHLLKYSKLNHYDKLAKAWQLRSTERMFSFLRKNFSFLRTQGGLHWGKNRIWKHKGSLAVRGKEKKPYIPKDLT